MSLTVSNNIFSIQRSLTLASTQANESMKRLSSGERIITAKDDAAGLAIATRMQSRLQGMTVAQRNAGDGLSMAQAADNALGQTGSILTRMRELATQAANATNSDEDRAKLNEEYTALAAEVTRTLSGADFNGQKILSTDAGAKEFIVGADSTDVISVTTQDMTANANITASVSGDLTSAANAKKAMDDLAKALDDVSTERAKYGAIQSRFETAVTGLQSQAEALTAAKGRITDTDYAAEMASFQKNQVLTQAATAMLAQANQRPSMVLSLLR